MTKLIKDYGLHADDVFVHESGEYKIIRRRGYKKIQEDLDIGIKFELAHAGNKEAVVIATGTANLKRNGSFKNIHRQTFGEASPDNSTFEYPVSVAQKRAECRLILEMAQLYEQGFYGEDEIDETVKGSKLKKKADKVGTASVDNTLSKLGLKDEKKKD